MSAYSTRFYVGEAPANAATVLYTVPSGYVIVVRCIDAVAATPGTAGAAQVLITGKGYIFSGSFTSSSAYLHWDGRQVLVAGEQLGANITTVATWLCISGYLLLA